MIANQRIYRMGVSEQDSQNSFAIPADVGGPVWVELQPQEYQVTGEMQVVAETAA